MQVSEVKITYKNRVKAADRTLVNSSLSAYNFLAHHWTDDIELSESFYVIYTDRAHRALACECVSKGGITATVVDVRLVFVRALLLRATGVILAHNHPSGQLRPSKMDINLTNKINEGGKTLDIQLLDHIIVTPDEYYSFADNGLIK